MRVGIILLFLLCLDCEGVCGQRPNARDTVVELSRVDMNRAVELQIFGPNKNNAVKEAIKKQISDDFRALQALNNKMMSDTWARRDLDYKYVSGMVAQIAKKAERLKSNLGLPQQNNEQKKMKGRAEISSVQDFKTELLALDRSVMSFVTNPIFQKTSVVELKMANQASRDLSTVIHLSKRLKKIGEKLAMGN
jgi:hypothetical protein